MTEQTERLSAISSSNEEVDYVGHVDVKVDDVNVDHDVELSEGETFEQSQPKKQKMKKKNKKMNKQKPEKDRYNDAPNAVYNGPKNEFFFDLLLFLSLLMNE